jgi:hypothetical protein
MASRRSFLRHLVRERAVVSAAFGRCSRCITPASRGTTRPRRSTIAGCRGACIKLQADGLVRQGVNMTSRAGSPSPMTSVTVSPIPLAERSPHPGGGFRPARALPLPGVASAAS